MFKLTRIGIWALKRGSILLFFGVAAIAQATPDAQALLAASDAIRNPSKPFGTTIRLIEYRAGHQVDESTLNIYSKLDSSSGQYRNLIRYAAPPRDINKLMLKNGNDLWFFDPASQASVRISPQQRLLGNASNGDVVTANLTRDYLADMAGEEDIQDGDLQQRHCKVLELIGNTTDANYHRVRLWLDAATSQPVKAQYYSASAHLIKSVYYRRLQQVLGELRPTEAVIIDGSDSEWVTIMRFFEHTWRDIPDAWLQRDYLPRFRPE